jgi:hypothetical protein
MKTIRDRITDLEKKGYNHDFAIDRAYENAQNSLYDSRVRLDYRIKKMIETGEAVFFTLTLDTSCDLERESYYRNEAIEWSREHLRLFLGNVDYGSKKGRLHFHVIGVPKDQKSYARTWVHGASSFKRVRFNSSPKALRKYITKLVAHSLKDTASSIFRSKKKE